MRFLVCLLFVEAIAFTFQTRNRPPSGLYAKGQASSCPLSFLIGGNTPFTPKPGSLTDQTIVITGGSGGLGLESAKRLAVGGASIILTTRSVKKAEQAVFEVKKYLNERGILNGNISAKLLDLDDLQDVRRVPETWKDVERIDVLLNNAGIMALPKMELTTDGYEKQIQSNHLGHFALTALLSSKFATNARIINVSSSAHQFAPKGMLSGDALWNPDSFDYSGWPAYGQSKLANILFTKELQRRCMAAGKDWTVTCLHPGVVATDLGRYIIGNEQYDNMKSGNGNLVATLLSNVFSTFLQTPEEGATTQIWLAARADQESKINVRGEYLSDCKIQTLGDYATNAAAAERLWKESEDKSQVDFFSSKILANF